MGPTTKPRLATIAHTQITHTRSFALYMSSMLPTTTVVGIDETKPLTSRPTATPINEGTAATTAHEMLYTAVLAT